VTGNGDAPAMTDAERVRLGLALQGAAQVVQRGIPADATAEDLLAHLGALRVLFDASDAGNAQQGKPAGPLRPYRTALYHRLADMRVPRAKIATAAGVSENAIGFAFKGDRRGRPPRPSAQPAAVGDPAGDESRTRRQRPG
jgi:hypothetical protein